MEPNDLSNSVQDEQFDKSSVSVENTENSAPLEQSVAPSNENIIEEIIKPEAQLGLDNSYETDEFPGEEHPIINEEHIPVELQDEEDELHDESHISTPSSDYSTLSKEEIVQTAEKLLKEKPIESLKADFDNLKIQFYKKHKADNEKLRKQFVENGGTLDTFKPDTDPLEEKIKEVLKKYKDIRSDFNKKSEAEKLENLNAKHAIIEEIKALINGNESFNDTFQQFRDLQKKWRSIGLVPQTEMNNLWESYNHNVEKFYDFIKINKELRDLDLKRNHEAKIEICEKAEELLLESSIVKAFKQLQEYHFKWRDIGPVPNEMRTEIWNRFKDITTKINKRHQEYFDEMKVSQQQNLEAKTLLCNKAEEILKVVPETMKDWEDKTKELVELQTVWKTIGFAPKKENTQIYQNFRSLCDDFYAKKRDFYGVIKEEQNNNLQTKIDLCIQAEALKDSTEWKKSTEDLIQIQKKWKEVGPVPRKMSDQVWKRFRAACDTFFNNKSTHFASVDSQYETNLQLKLTLIEEIEKYQLLDNVEQDFSNLKEFQHRWAEIGFVPLKQKEEIQKRYHNIIDSLFNNLKLDDGKRKIMKFKNKIEQMPHNNKNEHKIDRERDKLIIQLKKLESDIILWDNNIGFFAKSKNAEAMINEVQSRIDNARAEIKVLEQKIKMIDNI